MWHEILTSTTECFYNRQGKWYYAGQYVALRLDDLSAKEWNELDAEVKALYSVSSRTCDDTRIL